MTSGVDEYLEAVKNAWEMIVGEKASDASILEYLNWCEQGYAEMGQPQADSWRLLAYVHSRMAGRRSIATSADVEELWTRRDTWGSLLMTMASTYYQGPPYQATAEQIAQMAYAPELWFKTLWDLRVKLTTPVDAVAAMAMVCADRGEYARAHEILQQVAGSSSPSVHIAEAILFYRARLWPDAITAAKKLSDPPMLNMDDTAMHDSEGRRLRNEQLACAGALIQAVGYAHLNQMDTAESLTNQMLESSHSGNFPGVASAGFYLLGMIERRRGKESAAQEHLGRALALSPLPEVEKAVADPSVSLSITREDLIAQRRNRWDPSTEPVLEQVLAGEAKSSRMEMLEAAEAELARQIGMDDVKQQVQSLRKQVAYAEEMKRRGKARQARSNHLVLSGPPGTGKTTIARVIAQIYCGYGVLPTDRIVEVQRKDLIGQYEGQTTERAAEVIASAMGGVLFIDEAYTLIQDRNGKPDPFGQEIVELLLKEMEDHRDNLVVIIAGYEDKLRSFLQFNDGLQGRFKRWIQFQSYTPHELAQIAQVIAVGRDSTMGPEQVAATEQAIIEQMAGAQTGTGLSMIDKAGNGRFVRNVVEVAEEFREDRLGDRDLSALTDAELVALTNEDLVQAVERVAGQYR